MSGGGVERARTRPPASLTPIESPAKSVPSSWRSETWWLAWPVLGKHASPTTSSPTIWMFSSGTGTSSPTACRTHHHRASGARLQTARLDEMRCADPGHVDPERGVLAHESSCGAGVIEVDVGEQQMSDVAELEPTRCEARLQRGNAGRLDRSRRVPSRRRCRRGSTRHCASGQGAGDRSVPVASSGMNVPDRGGRQC